MELRKLGSSGLKISVVGIGCNNFGGRCDQKVTKEIVHTALDFGINFFDTADVYGMGRSEKFVGEFIKSVSELSLIHI